MKLLLSILFFILRAAAAVLFISAGAAKIANPGQFLLEIRAFEILPYWMAFSTALVLPWLELLSGLALLTMKYSSAASLILMTLTISFINFIAIAKRNGIDTDCGCFGQWNFIGGNTEHIVFNSALLGVLALTFWRCAKLQRIFDADR
ncbi:MAG: hypothetical protein JW942_01835 [Opitutales bacterium]|nr:hypothetical protein [Opitutales bacterium]